MAKPVSFFSRGQRMPDGLEPATADMLLDLVLGPPSAALKYEVVAA